MSSVVGLGKGLAGDVIFHHVPDGTSSYEGWVKREFILAELCVCVCVTRADGVFLIA